MGVSTIDTLYRGGMGVSTMDTLYRGGMGVSTMDKLYRDGMGVRTMGMLKGLSRDLHEAQITRGWTEVQSIFMMGIFLIFKSTN